MLALLNETFARMQPQLRARVGAGAYDAWLAGLRLIAIERGICYLQAKNKLTCDRVRSLFGAVLEEMFSHALGTKIAVKLLPEVDSLLPDRLEVGPSRPIVDDCNRQAWLVLEALSQGRALPASQFLFHGPAGVGKSFLLRSWRDGLKSRCLWFGGTHLLRAMQSCLRDGRLERFREELMADLPLAIDEVHRLAGHVRLQRELLGILRRRKPLRSPTLLISRWHPREIRRFDATLCSHLLSGFLIRLDYPGPDARLRYLRALEGSASRNGRGPVIMSLARDVRGSFTDLRRVWAAGREGLDRCPGYLFFADPRALFTRLCEQVAQRFEVQSEEIIGRKQTRHISQARQVLCQLCVNKGFNRAEIGRFLGGRSRAAVSHAIKALQRRMSATPVLRALVESLQ